ncbi:MAG: stage III sporulation protein AE [Acutalibacteraceae bacterium]|nr:stage III sporulation protein AE [Acutalibacteraceae bacterium]
MVGLITVFSSCTLVYADDELWSEEEIYNEQYRLSGADTLIDELPNETKKQLKDIGITSPNWKELNSLSFSEIFNNLLSQIGSQSIMPLNCVIKIIGVILLVALINSVKTTIGSSSLTSVLDCVSVLSVSIILIEPISHTINYSATVIKLSSDFMLIFTPIMITIMLSVGQSMQGTTSYTMVMGVGTAVSQIATNILEPLLNIFLGMSVVGGISQRVKLSGFCDLVYKLVKWSLTFIMSIFTTILSMQSVISASVDSATTKATRFAINSFVPLVGGALSEAYQTVRSCMGMLKSGIGVFAILATGFIYLPAIISCVLWLVAINISVALAEVFDIKNIITLLKSIATVINSLIAILLCCMIIFIISSTVMLLVGGVA